MNLANAIARVRPWTFGCLALAVAGVVAADRAAEQRMQAAISRFVDHDHNVNSLMLLDPSALMHARALGEEPLSPLHGQPVLIKGNIALEGLPNTAGSWLLRDNVAAADAFVVKRMRESGLIPLGLANLSEWANFRSLNSSSGWSSLGGLTRNPHDTTRSSCGSSSGSAAAVAAGFVDIAVGTETNGSIICPSATHGLVGIKPTLGLVSRSDIIPIAHSQDTAGPIARNVTLAVQLLDAMVGMDSDDPASIAAEHRYQEYLKVDGLKGKRVGVVRSLMGYSERLDSIFEDQLKVLRSAGAIIVDEELEIENRREMSDAEWLVLRAEFKHDLNQYLAKARIPGLPNLAALIAANEEHADKVMPHFGQEIFALSQAAPDLDSEEYSDALATARRLAQVDGIDRLLREHSLDLLIAPTTGPAWKIDYIYGDTFHGSASGPAAVAGYPHITVPMGDIGGLPVGISFFAGARDEAVLIEAAFAYEQATGHGERLLSRIRVE